MVILVIGPSGVGKSDYGSHAAKVIRDFHFFDLDALVSKTSGTPASQLLPKIGNDAFLDRCKKAVDDISKSFINGIGVVAVGAGTLQSGRSGAWLSGHKGPIIAVLAPADEVYQRGGVRNRIRSLEQFKEVEYSHRRLGLYNAAQHQVNVAGLSVDEARGRFTEMIKSLLEKQS